MIRGVFKGKALRLPPFRFRKRQLFLVLPLGLLAAAGVFFVRRPVVFVTGEAYTSLYGSGRAFYMTAKASLGAFRRIITVNPPEEADASLVLLAAEGAAEAPFCVIFPYRCRQTASSYSERRPETPVFLLMGRSRETPALPAGVFLVRTDIIDEMTRAGAEAGALAGKEGAVIVIDNNWLRDPERAVFLAALKAAGAEKEPQYFRSPDGAHSCACAVITGPIGNFLDQNQGVPVILFSWLNPGFVSDEVKVIVDDSPWAQLSGLLKAPLPSEAPPQELTLRSTVLRRGGIADFR
ncbi:MAG: hypothetical protein LBR16_06140 [Treponema sp.]|nr:hypothetical protein [Treponema sp.]